MNIGSESRALLGELFFRAGLINIDQLCHALFVSYRNNLPLGRVMVMLGMIKTRVLEGAITLQTLVRQNRLAPELAIQALTILGTNKVRVSEVLIDMGWQGDPTMDNGELGALLIEANILTRKSIDDALGLSKHIGLPLSRVLVLQGLISGKLLSATLKCQDMIRSGRTERKDALNALSSAASLIEFEKSCERLLDTQQTFIKLEELLLLSRLITDQDLRHFEKHCDIAGGKTLGEYIVESGIFSSTLIAAAVRLQTMIARFEITPYAAAGALRLIFSKNLSMMEALKEMRREGQPYDGKISLYHLLRLSGLVTAYDIRRLGHLPGNPSGSDPLEERLLKAGILNRSSMDAARRCHLLMNEGFLTAEQAMIVLQHWSWSGEGLTRVLEKLQWGEGQVPTLKALAFRA